MSVPPRLKTVPVYGDGTTLVLCRRSLERTYLADPRGAVLALLKILAAGEHELAALEELLDHRSYRPCEGSVGGCG